MFFEALKQLEASKEFHDFKQKNPEAYLCAAFFVKDFESNSEQRQLDFADKKQVTTFVLEEKITIKTEKTDKCAEELSKNITLDMEKAVEIAKAEIQKIENKAEINKVIAILQVLEKQLWNLTCFLPGFKIFSIHVDMQGNILKSEMKNMFDFFKKA